MGQEYGQEERAIEEASVDGRATRALRSRRAICQACLDLVEEGCLQPSADQIADRAGLSRRSVFYHFRDLAALYEAVVDEGLKRCQPLRESVAAEGPVGARVDRLAFVRARYLEATTPYRRAMTATSLVGPSEDAAFRLVRELLADMRDEVEEVFAPELIALPADVHRELGESLAAASCPSQWEYLRFGRGLPVEAARNAMTRTLRALLVDAGIGLD